MCGKLKGPPKAKASYSGVDCAARIRRCEKQSAASMASPEPAKPARSSQPLPPISLTVKSTTLLLASFLPFIPSVIFSSVSSDLSLHGGELPPAHDCDLDAVMQRKLPFIVLLLLACCYSRALRTSWTDSPNRFARLKSAPAEPGVLANVQASEGDAVELGQLLGTLDNEVLQIAVKIAKQVAELRGKYEAAKAERDLRSDKLQRLQSLSVGFAHREEIDRATTDLAVAEANALALEEQRTLDTLEYEKTLALLERRMIRSPAKGVITKVHHEQGEYIAGSTPTVFTIVQLNPLRVVFAAPAAIAREMKLDQSVTIRFPDTRQECNGRVELISPVIDAESGLVRVKVLIPNPGDKFPCGARCVLGARSLSATSTTVGNDLE